MSGRDALVLLAALIAAAGTARLGWWQLDRAQQKLALQQSREARGSQAPLDAGALARRPEDARGQWDRRTRVEGRWLDASTVYLDNRPMQGRAGLVVVTPLQMDDGRTVVVQRGWLPRHAADRARIAPYRTDSGRVTVSGRIAPSTSRLFELGEAPPGSIRQNLDLVAYAGEIGRPLLPLVIVQDDPGPEAGDGLGRHWPQPAADVHKHHGYAFQWFGLSGLVVILYVWFKVIRPRRRSATP